MKDLAARVGVAGVVSLALALLIPVAVMWTLYPITSDMPQWDQWSMAPVFEAHYSGRPVLPLLLAHYNGHYNWLPRFMFYGMGLLGRWDTRLEVVMGFFWAGCALVLLLRMSWETSPRLLLMAAPFAAWVFSILQFGNFLNGYGMGQLMAGFFALLSLYLLSGPGAGRARFAWAVVIAAGAFISHGAGLALAPAGLAVLLLIAPRPNWARVAVWTAVSACGLALGVLGSTHLGGIFWRRIPGFALTLLGRPFTVEMHPAPRQTAMLGAAVLVTLLAVVAWRVAREWSTRREVLVRWGSVALLALVTIGLISYSRAGSPYEWGQATHYVTSTYPVAIALMALAADGLRAVVARSGRSARLAAAGLVVCVAAPLAQQALAAHRLLPILRGWHGVAERNVRRLVVGTLSDSDILASLHPEVSLVRAGVETLRTRRLAWFAHAREARRPFGSLDAVGGQPAASRAELKPGAPWVFEGWALPPLTAPDTPLEVAVRVDGAVVATIVPNQPRTDIEAYYGSRRFLTRGFALAVPDGARRPPGRYSVRVVARTEQQGVLLRKLDVVVAP